MSNVQQSTSTSSLLVTFAWKWIINLVTFGFTSHFEIQDKQLVTLHFKGWKSVIAGIDKIMLITFDYGGEIFLNA